MFWPALFASQHIFLQGGDQIFWKFQNDEEYDLGIIYIFSRYLIWLKMKISFFLLFYIILVSGGARTYELGFGYGATWGSIILIFASVVLLICDRESEEIFYKERQVEDEEEGEEEA